MRTATPEVEFPPEELARVAGLRYVADEEIGFSRTINGHGFVFLNGHGRQLRDKRHMQRIEALAIPPAWADVWICRFADGHLQATGRDARGRKQYLYHQAWREISNAAKFWRLRACPRLLPKLRRRVARDLRGRTLSEKRVLAGMVAILDLTSIRVGNEEYVRENGSYGLTTLRNRHVRFERGRAILKFRAKSGLRREVVIADPKLVRLLKQLQQLPGVNAFQFLDEEGAIRRADAATVNAYLQQLTPRQFTAKDFRTWKGSALAAGILHRDPHTEKLAHRKRAIKRAIAAVAETLGNTPTVCRKYYIHPALLDRYLNGELPTAFFQFQPSRHRGLSPDEQIFARFLRSA
jgi:DNA topoisomerase-1